MANRKVTRRNIRAVLNKLGDFILESPSEVGDALCESVDAYLDELCDDDTFGTEGQLDPRGDQRD